MPSPVPIPPASFVGRDDFVGRFRARFDHFNFFIFQGIQGVGKTWLMLRLAKEARALGCTQGIYMPLSPGEGIFSVLARAEARFRVRSGAGSEHKGDPYARLLELLSERKAVLLLDMLHNMRERDLPALVRSLRGHQGTYKVLGAIRGDPGLSAMDRMQLHLERVGPLCPEDVVKVGKKAGIPAEGLEILGADAQRGGCSGHALTLRFMLSLYAPELPPEEFLTAQTSRSVNAFRALINEAGDRLGEEDRLALSVMARIGQPLTKEVAATAVGRSPSGLIKRGFIDEVAGECYVHPLIGQVLGKETLLEADAAKAVAEHLHKRAVANSEPVGTIRAAEVLARAGRPSEAVEVLAGSWETVRDLGFLEAYLKALASIDTGSDGLASRVRLLALRARMRQGYPQSVRSEMEKLAAEKDRWTRVRAFAALTYIHSESHQHAEVVKAFESMQQESPPPELAVPAASTAAASMVRIGMVAEAEKLAVALLSKLKGKEDAAREGEFRRLLARIYAQGGQVSKAVEEARKAAKAFEVAGDLYHAATAQGFIGDLHRQAGEFEEARSAFRLFRERAGAWGDRDLIQIAELADAWVSLDVGDLTHAARQIAEVEKEMSAAPSRRLKRYLAAAKALCEAGRGRHAAAAKALARVVEAWDGAGQTAIADSLRAQQVRSLIACGQLEEARAIVDPVLDRLDPKSAAPRVAAFLRERALIRLRRREVMEALRELDEARRLFSMGGNRREEALTLHRIAHAARDEGDLKLAKARAREALDLGRKIKHTRAIALAREAQGRIALAEGDAKEAITCMKEALQSLRKLGDDLGTLHVSVSLVLAHVVGGDLAAAIRLGPRVKQHAESLGVGDVAVRAAALIGVALLRRGRLDQAAKWFREVPERAASASTAAIMWRFGEGLAALAGEAGAVQKRRTRWVEAVRSMPENRHRSALLRLEQLVLPPRNRAYLRTDAGSELVGTEQSAWLRPRDFSFFVDVLGRRVCFNDKEVRIDGQEAAKLFFKLVVAAPEPLPMAAAARSLMGEKADQEHPEAQVKPVVKALQQALKTAKGVKVTATKTELRLGLPKGSGLLVPTSLAVADLSGKQRRILRILRRQGTAPLQTLQGELEMSRGSARRELGQLVEAGLVEAVRDGRGQAFRLA